MLKRAASKSLSLIAFASFLAIAPSCGSNESDNAPREHEREPPNADPALAPDASVSSQPDDGGEFAKDASVGPVPETPEALAVVNALRAKFVFKVSDPVEPTPSDEARSKDASIEAPRTGPALGLSVANGFESRGEALVPRFLSTNTAASARVALSRNANSPFRFEDTATGVAVDVALRNARDAPAEAAEGFLVYRHAHASGATLLHRALPEGTEDFLSFDEAPASPAIAYDVTLRHGVGGLRLVANTLEILDAKGAPRLRVSPPSIATADGQQIDATLALDDCAYDDDASAPWDRPVLAPGADTCALRVTWPSDAVTYPALLDPKWSTTASMSVARQDHTATVLSTGKVLVAGGTNGTTTYTTAELYDRATGTWAATGSMTGARKQHSATQLPTSSNATTSGKVLVAGGVNGSSTLNTAQLYSPTAGTWTAAANLNAARALHTATLLANGKVLIAGGQSGSTVLNTAATYNPASGTGSWTATGNMTGARRSHTATLLTTSNGTLNNKVLVVGGDSGTASLTSVQLFDGTSSWSTLTALSSARQDHTATLLANGKVLIAGGKSGGTTLATTLLFNPASGSGSWSSGGTMTSARHGHSATLLSTTVVSNGQLLVAGGWNGSVVLSSAELFNGTSTWTATTALPAAVKYHTASALTNGLVLIAGGVDSSTTTVINKAYLYDPSRGLPCTSASQCPTGFCANGVCCDTACVDECGACNLSGLAGTCSPKASGTACSDDGNPCTTDKCNGASVTCQHAAGNAGTVCRPAVNVCDLSEACSGTSTSCPTDVKAPNGTACNDGNACTTADKCSSGACIGGAPPVTDDNNPCTADSCNPASGVVHTPLASGTSCADANICNGVESCDGSGLCLPGAPPFVDDGNPCTVDTCDAVNGVRHTPAPGTACGDLCSGAGTCNAAGVCVGGTPVVCDEGDQCHAAGTCDPATGLCSSQPLPDGTACDDGLSCTQGDTCQAGVCAASHACTADCPCDSGGTCTTDQDCSAGLVCGPQNGRYFGKDPLSSVCWPPRCATQPEYMGCGGPLSPCGACPPAPPRICSSDTDCQSTNEVCGQGNGAAFGLGNVNVCWPPVCGGPGGQALCGSPFAPCGNCACSKTCGSKNCSTPDKSDGCGGYCEGLCGDAQPGCASNLDCQNDSVCSNGTCLPPLCLALDPSRNCPGDHSACPSCPQCVSLCAAEGRECGPDPAGCSANCGSCGSGLSCTNGRCISSSPPTSVEPTAEVGTLEGNFEVTDSGQAQYGIRIAVPPGRAGLQPDIGLVYKSDKKLGSTGIGWHLTGFSSIARCSTRAANEGPRAVRYDSGDRFCLDGKRLIALSDGTYRTEVDDFSKITIASVDSQGQPGSFKVFTKAGTVFTYGGTDDASVFHRIYSPNFRTPKRLWAVSSVADRNGNNIHFTYDARRASDNAQQPGLTSEMVPVEVSYGANGDRLDDRGVRFIYEDVGIRSLHYVSGSGVTLQQRVKEIQTYARTGIAKRYHLEYDERGSLFRLIHARECAPDATGVEVCKPQTTFSYEEGNQGTAFDAFGTVIDSQDKPLANWHGTSADIDGDGIDNLWFVGLRSDGSTTPFNADGLPVDLNNDGKEEILRNVVRNGNALDVLFGLPDSDASNPAYAFTPSTSWKPAYAYAADIDGDGLKDILLCGGDRLGYLKGGTVPGTPDFKTIHPLPSWGTCESTTPMLVDVDDDGVVNWIRPEKPGSPVWKYLLFPTDPNQLPAWQTLLFFNEESPAFKPMSFMTLDANGDGLTDILARALWLNQGDGSFREAGLAGQPEIPLPSIVFDYDGDGNDDSVRENAWLHWPAPGLTTKFEPPTAQPIRFTADELTEPGGFSAFLADVNGDGDLDLIEAQAPQPGSGHSQCKEIQTKGIFEAFCRPQVRYGHSRRMHLLTSVVDGLGRKTDIFYNGRARQTIGACAGSTDLLCPTKSPPLVGEHRFSTIAPQGTDTTPRKFFKYTYGDARVGTHDRGSYGFGTRSIEEYDGAGSQDTPGPLFSVTDLTYFNTDFVRAGLVKSRRRASGQISNGVDGFVQPSRRILLDEFDYDVVHDASHGGISFPVLRQSRTSVRDLPVGSEAELAVSTEINDFTRGILTGDYDCLASGSLTNGYDCYGNSKYHRRRTFVRDEFSGQLVTDTSTDSSFKAPDVTNWLIGLIETTQVADTRGGSTQTRNWSYGYDDATGRLLHRTRDPGGPFQQIEEFRYEDPVHNMTTHVLNPGPNERATTIFYDDDSLTFPNLTYNALHQGQTTVFEPRFGNLVRTIDANGLNEIRTYDAFGRLAKTQGPSGNIHITLLKGNQQFLFTPPGDSRAVMRVLSQEFSTAGNKIGANKIEDFGPLGEILKRDVAAYQVDPNRLDYVEEVFSYDHIGRLQSQTRPHLAGFANDQGEVAFAYDNLGDLVEEIFPDANGTTSVFHARATINTWLSDPSDFFTANGAVATDVVSQRVPSTDGPAAAFAKSPVRALDPEGLVVVARDAMGTFSDYSYGPFRQLQSVFAARDQGQPSSIEYDKYGRKKVHSDPDLGTETYDVYNAFDELESVTDARGVNKSFVYDALGRMKTSRAFVTGLPVPDESITWDYDGIPSDPGANEVGRLVRVSFSNENETNRHVTRYRYQAGNFGLLESVDRKIAADTFATAFEYESDFQRLNVVHYPDAGGGFSVKRQYDPRGNLLAVADANNPSTVYWQVTGTGQGYRIESEQFGNGAITASSYDPFTGRLRDLKTTASGDTNGVEIQNFHYTFMPNGNLQTRNNITHGRLDAFRYDDLNRLRFVTQGSQPEAEVATYNFRGNITSKIGVGTYDYAFPTGMPAPQHAPHTIVNGGVTRTFTYDAVGNEVMREGGPEGTRTTDYTSFNLPKVISDTLPETSTTTFEYDGTQSRVTKVDNGVRQTVYAGELYERVTDSSGGTPEVTHKYRVFAEGKQVAQLERRSGTNDNLVYLHGDHLGSTQLITRDTATPSSALILHEQTFDPWGKPEGTNAWDAAADSRVRNVRAGFTGHEHDPEHGLINMRGRIYDPELGRFMTADPFVQNPFDSQSLNRYAYVSNNPLRYTDPSGFRRNQNAFLVVGGQEGLIEFSQETISGTPGGDASTTPSEAPGTPGQAAEGAESGKESVAATPDDTQGGGAPGTGGGGSEPFNVEIEGPVSNPIGSSTQPGARESAMAEQNQAWNGVPESRGGLRRQEGQDLRTAENTSAKPAAQRLDAGTAIGAGVGGAVGGTVGFVLGAGAGALAAVPTGEMAGPVTIPAGAAGGASVGAALGMAAGAIIGSAIEKLIGVIETAFAKPIDSEDAKAPGAPTAQDGWEAPRNWDGRLVKNPNGPGYGWPDGNGDVWVPTGPGPRAHGGPHWDVQKRGGGYENVYPGGKRR